MSPIPPTQFIPPDETGFGYIVIPFRAGQAVHVDDVLLPLADHLGPLDGAGAISAKLMSTDPESVARRVRRMRERGEVVHVSEYGHTSAPADGQVSAGLIDCIDHPLPTNGHPRGSTMTGPFPRNAGGQTAHGGHTDTGDAQGGPGCVLPFPTPRRCGEPIPDHLRTPTVQAMESIGHRFGVPLDMDRLRQVQQAFARVTGRALPHDPAGLDLLTAEVATASVSAADLTHAAAWPWAYFGGVLADACGKMRPPAWAKNAPTANVQPAPDRPKAPDPAPIKNATQPPRAAPMTYGPDGYEQQPPTPEGVHDEAWSAAWSAVVRCQTVRPGDRRGKARDVALQWQNRFPAAMDDPGRLRGAVLRWVEGAATDPGRHKAIPSVEALTALLPRPKPEPRGGSAPVRVFTPEEDAQARLIGRAKCREIMAHLARLNEARARGMA